MKYIELIYTRLPNQVSHFQQELLYEDATVIVTQQKVKISEPLVIEDMTVLDDGYTAVWFIFDNRWYDIGKMYTLQGTFTGYYCDIIQPSKRSVSTDNQFLFTVEITDLCLDLWVYPDGRYHVLDEDEFEIAVCNGWIDDTLAQRAKKELQMLIQQVTGGTFPPAITNSHTN